MYEVFVYMGEMNRLSGDYFKIAHIESLPYIGMDAGNGYKVSAIYDSIGIIDVVLERFKDN